jgi:hypothetical protein
LERKEGKEEIVKSAIGTDIGTNTSEHVTSIAINDNEFAFYTVGDYE